MSRRRVVGLAAAMVVAVLAWIGVGLLRDVLYTDHARPGASAVQVQIAPGTSLRAAARVFHERGVLEHPWALRALARMTGTDVAIKAGTYAVEPGIAPARLLRKLVAGEIVTVAVTVPEGLTMRAAVEVLGQALALDPARLLALAQGPAPRWRERLELPPGATLEGYLFPETYRFALGVSPEEVVEAMVTGFARAFGDSLRQRARTLGLSVHQVVTLASIVEAEARRPDERGRIAAVYSNRLRRGMRLEADPTVAYALRIKGDALTLAHLRTASPYNTYLHTGLPPGPINSPGEACLRAALWPQPGFDAVFFVADGLGGHRFASTWAEHRRNVRAYRQARGASGGAGRR